MIAGGVVKMGNSERQGSRGSVSPPQSGTCPKMTPGRNDWKDPTLARDEAARENGAPGSEGMGPDSALHSNTQPAVESNL